MFEKYLEKLIRQTIGDFIEDFDSKELSVGLWSGKVDIKSLRLKRHLFRNYKIPIQINYSSIKGLSLKIPWKNLFTSPLVVTIDSVLVLCEFAQKSLGKQELQAAVIKLIDSTIRQLGQQLAQKGKQKSEVKEKSGMVQNLTYKMLDNLYLSIKNIHIRFEQRDENNNSKMAYSFGCSLQSLDLFAVDSNNQKVFIDRSKLNMGEASLRKKIEMKNLAVYCNIGRQDFITAMPIARQNKISEILTNLILKSSRGDSSIKNNYILIMNVIGMIDQTHIKDLVKYLLNLNFERLVVKVDKDVLKALLFYIYTLNRLTEKYNQLQLRQELFQEECFLLRKYCNAFLSDFKVKQIWTPKDRTALCAVISEVDSKVIIQQIKTIMVYQISVIELSKYCDVGAEDLNKGLLQLSKQIREIQQPNIKFNINVPQITIYLVNQFSQALLELNILSFLFRYQEYLVSEGKINDINIQIGSVSAVSNGVYLLSCEHLDKADLFCQCKLQLSNSAIETTCSLSSFSFYYYPPTLEKVMEMFQFGDFNHQYKSVAIEKIEQLESKVNKKVKTASEHLRVLFILKKPKILLKETTCNWILETAKVELNYESLKPVSINGDSLKMILTSNRQQRQIIQPINFSCNIDSHLIKASISPISIKLDKDAILSLQRLASFLLEGDKAEIVSKASRTGEAFLKMARWTKCLISLKDRYLYGWELQSDKLLFRVQLKHVLESRRGKIDVLEVSDKRITYWLAFKEETKLKEWKKAFQDRISTHQQTDKGQQLSGAQMQLETQIEHLSLDLVHHSSSKVVNETLIQVSPPTVQTVSHLIIGQIRLALCKPVQQSKTIIQAQIGQLGLNHNEEKLLYSIYAEQPSMSVSATLQADIQLGINFSRFQMCYKPQAFIRMIAFFKHLQTSQEDYSHPFLQPSTQQNSQAQLIDPAKVHIKLTQFQIILQNKLTHIPLTRIICRQLQANLTISETETLVDGSLADFQIKDLSGYPNTTYIKYLGSKPSECSIFQANEASNQMSFQIELFHEGSHKCVGGMPGRAKVSINNCKISYVHEVIFRFVDYINTQFLGVLYYPQIFPEFSSQQERGFGSAFKRQHFSLACSQSLKAKELRLYGKEKAMKMTYLKPIALQINFTDTCFFFLSSYQALQGIRLEATSILLTNQHQLEKRQAGNTTLEIPIDIYSVLVEGIVLSTLNSSNIIGFTSPIKDSLAMKIGIRYFGKAMDLQYLYGQDLPIRNEIGFDIEFLNVHLQLTKDTITSILKVINHNIKHEDGLGFVMNYEYIPEWPASCFEVNLHSHLISFDILSESRHTIRCQLGQCRFQHSYANCNSQNLMETKYLALSYAEMGPMQTFQQVATNRKLSSRLSEFGTIGQRGFQEIVNHSKESLFKYSTITNLSSKDHQQHIHIFDAAFTLTPQFIDSAYTILRGLPAIEPLPPAYEEQEESQSTNRNLFNKPKHSQEFKLQKILLSYSTVGLNHETICLYSNTAVVLKQDLFSINITDLEMFLPHQDNPMCEDLPEIKKRTLLLPTSLKINLNPDITQVEISKLFFKLSLSDFSTLFSAVSELKQIAVKLQQAERQSKGLSYSEEEANLLQTQKNILDNELKTPLRRRRTLVNKTLNSETILSPPRRLTIVKKNTVEAKDAEGFLERVSQLSKGATFKEGSQIEAMDRESKISIEGIEVMVIDNLSKYLTPILYLNCFVSQLSTDQAMLQLYADYFNLRNSCWQPVVEKTRLHIAYSTAIVVNLTETKQPINFNISVNLIENVLKALNHQQLKSSRMFIANSYLDTDQINSWILINQLGHDVLCSLPDALGNHEAVTIRQGETQTLPFLTKEKAFKQKIEEDVAVRLQIGAELTIKRLKVNQMGLKRLKIDMGNSSSIIIKSLHIDLSKNLKLITLSSQILFENKSDIVLTFFEEKQEKLLQVLPHKTAALPFNYQLGNVYYYPERGQSCLSLVNLQKRSKIMLNSCQLRVTCQSKRLRKHICFYPFYKINNYLPHSLIINFKLKQADKLYASLELGPYNSNNNFAYLYHPLEQLEASLCIDSYHSCDFVEWTSGFVIKDYRGNKHIVRCQNYRDQTPMVSIALTANFVVTNKSENIIDIFSDQNWTKLAPSHSLIAQSSLLTLALEGQKSTSFYLPKQYFEVVISSPPRDCFSNQTSLCVFRNKRLVEGKVQLNIFQIRPMYVFRNEHSQNVVLRQQGSTVGEIQMIRGSSHDSITWFLTSSKRRPPIFRLTLEDSYYDWSFAFNITVQKEFYFLLRNKYHYLDVRYCNLKVNKVKQTFQCVFRELKQEEIPFIIRNSTNYYTVLITNMKVSLRPQEQSYFMWDDPMANDSIVSLELIPNGHSYSPQDIIPYQIKVNHQEQQPIKSHNQHLDLEVVKEINRQVFIFRDSPKNQVDKKLSIAVEVKMPVRFALINNSISPALHLLDMYTQIHLSCQTFSDQSMSAKLQLAQIQIDNQTKPLTYFPVVLSTDISIYLRKEKYLEAEVETSKIRLNIEEDFLYDLMAFGAQLKKVTSQSEVPDETGNKKGLFISKLKLPKITVELEIQTKKLSIETVVHLQKPQIISYPWKEFPYPLKTIAFNILSHLSISPWAFISSLGKGLEKLLTEHQASRGVQGFLQQLLGGATASLSGMLGIIVGHDIEKVENFIDGVNKGVGALGKSIVEILPSFQGDYSAINIMKELGMGVVKVVIKPVAGLLRMTMKISQGIRKTTKFQFVCSDKTVKKRLPIVFYQRQQTYRSYCGATSQLMNSLKKCLSPDIRYFYLCELIPIDYKLKPHKQCLAIGTEQLVLFDVKEDRLIWRVQFDRIRKLQILNLCTVRIVLNEMGEEPGQGPVAEVDLTSEQSVRQVMQVMEKMRKTSSISL